MTVYDYKPGDGPVVPQCLWDGCDESEDLTVQEMAPGYTWSVICGRGHWIILGKKLEGDRGAEADHMSDVPESGVPE